MNIAVCVKLTPDAADIEVKNDDSISVEHAEWIIGGFDLQAIEAAMQIVEASSGKVTVISAGPHQIDNSKLKKDILSRGPDELFMIVDDALKNADTAVTATVLAAVVRRLEAIDLVLCGEGSADLYFQQVGLQVGELLGWPTTNFISKIEPKDGKLVAERTLEDEVEVLEIPLPAVLSVTTDITVPRLPSMKEILKASKKPITATNLAELGVSGEVREQLEVLSTKAPLKVQRKGVMIEGSPQEAAQTLVGYLEKEGLL